MKFWGNRFRTDKRNTVIYFKILLYLMSNSTMDFTLKEDKTYLWIALSIATSSAHFLPLCTSTCKDMSLVINIIHMLSLLLHMGVKVGQ